MRLTCLRLTRLSCVARPLDESNCAVHLSGDRSGNLKVSLLLGLLLITIVASAAGGYWYDNQPKVPATATASYVGRQSCVQCHQPQHELFLQSHHHKALEKANQESVLADFNDQSIEHDGQTSRFFRDGQKFMVTTEGTDGNQATFEVLYVLAYHPLQQYMVRVVDDSLSPESSGESATESGQAETTGAQGLPALQVLRLCWDVEGKRWFYLRPEDVPEKLEPGDPLHWTGVTQRWNTSCAACHSTDLQKNFSPESQSFATSFNEIDVSCEACHGPASLHVEIAQKKWLSWDPVHGKGLVSLKDATAKEQIETCAGCHSRRRLLAEDFHQTRQLHDHLIYEPMRAETYFVDGQIKDEDYVFGSFLQSKMHLKGIRCSDCHNPHSGKTHFVGNQLCTSCHAHPSGVFDSPQHHGHTQGSIGAQCVECHMPRRYYMDVDPRRDHSIRVPRPDLSVKLGVPNACTGCHLKLENVPAEIQPQLQHYQDWQKLATEGNQDVAAEIQRVDKWASEIVDQWRTARGKPITDPHFGERLAAARSLKPEDRSPTANKAREQLLKLAADPLQSPMYRVTIGAEVASWLDDNSLEQSIELLEDEDGEVVFFAMQRLQTEVGRLIDYANYGQSQTAILGQIQKLLQPVAELLKHPLRLVRNQAASTFASLPEDLRNEMLGDKLRDFETALNELIAVHLLNEELAAVADLYQSVGRLERAKEYYRLAVKHSSNDFGARTNLAVILESEIENKIRNLQQGGVTAADMQNQMQAILAEAGEVATEITALRERDFEILENEVQRSGHLPTAGDIHYRYAMALYLQGKMEETGKHLRIAVEKNPDTEAYLLAMATFYQAENKWDEVKKLSERLTLIDPQHPGYRSLLESANRHLENAAEDQAAK